MQVNFTKGEKKLFMGLKTKYFHFIMIVDIMRNGWSMKKKKKKQDKKPFTPEEVIEWMINREKLHINNELFKKHFKLQKPVLTYKVSYKTNNDKEKNSKLVKVFNSGLEYLEKEI